MTPQSKAEAVRLANEEAARLQRKVRWTIEDAGKDWSNTALLALARYIEANPAISVEDRTAARDTANYAARHWSKDTPEVAEAIRLLRLIAGPEEVDPLTDLIRETFARLPDPWNAEIAAKLAHEIAAERKLEITPITKQEGV